MTTTTATADLEQSIVDLLSFYARNDDDQGFASDLAITLRQIVPNFDAAELALAVEFTRMRDELQELDQEEDEDRWLTDPMSKASHHHY